MITGSHNPKNYNGVNSCRQLTIYGEHIEELYDIIENVTLLKVKIKGLIYKIKQ